VEGDKIENKSNAVKADRESPKLTGSWNDQSESDTDLPKEAASKNQGSAEKPRMRKKITQSKKESKIIVDYNDDQRVKTQKTVNSRNGDTWNHDRFEHGERSKTVGQNRGTIGQNRGQRGHGPQSEQNQREHGSRSEQNMRGHGSRSEQNHRGNGSQPQQNYRGNVSRTEQNHRGRGFRSEQNTRGRPGQNERSRPAEERNPPNHAQKLNNRGRFTEGRDGGMNGRVERTRPANQMNQHVQYVKDYMHAGESNLQKGNDEDYSPRDEEESQIRSGGSGRFKSHGQPKGVKKSDQDSSVRKPPRGRGNIMNVQPTKEVSLSAYDMQMQATGLMKPSNNIPGNGIVPFTKNPRFQQDHSPENQSPDGSDSDMTKSGGAKRYSNRGRNRPGRQPSVPPFQHPTPAPSFQQISPLLPMTPQFLPLPVPITLVNPSIPMMTNPSMPIMTTAQAFPTYTVAGDQGIVRGGVTYFNQPGSDMSEIRGGVTYFNPTAQNIILQQHTAQNILLQQQMHQRQTSAIAIVNPTQPNCIPVSAENHIPIQNLSNL